MNTGDARGPPGADCTLWVSAGGGGGGGRCFTQCATVRWEASDAYSCASELSWLGSLLTQSPTVLHVPTVLGHPQQAREIIDCNGRQLSKEPPLFPPENKSRAGYTICSLFCFITEHSLAESIFLMPYLGHAFMYILLLMVQSTPYARFWFE